MCRDRDCGEGCDTDWRVLVHTLGKCVCLRLYST